MAYGFATCAMAILAHSTKRVIYCGKLLPLMVQRGNSRPGWDLASIFFSLSLLNISEISKLLLKLLKFMTKLQSKYSDNLLC